MYGNSSNANELMAVIVANGLVSSIISTVLIILAIVGMWKMFRKAGKPGWAAIVPFYQTWVWGSVVFASKKKTIAWLVSEIVLAILLCVIVGIALTAAPASSGSMYSSRAMTYSQIPVQMSGGLMIASLLFALVGIVYTVLQLMAQIATAWSFGKRDGFAVGLIFLEPIFLAIIGLSGSIEYVGPGGAPVEGSIDDGLGRASGDGYWQSERVEEPLQAERPMQAEQPQVGQPVVEVPPVTLPVMPSNPEPMQLGQQPAVQMAAGMPQAMPQVLGQVQPMQPSAGQLTGEMPPIASPNPDPAWLERSPANPLTSGMPPVVSPVALPNPGQAQFEQPPAGQLIGAIPPVMPPNPELAGTAFAQQPVATPEGAMTAGVMPTNAPSGAMPTGAMAPETMPAAVPSGAMPTGAMAPEAMPAWPQDVPQIQQPIPAAGQVAWQPTATSGAVEPFRPPAPASLAGGLLQPHAIPGGFAPSVQPQAQPFDPASGMQNTLPGFTQQAFGQLPQQIAPMQPSWIPGQEPQVQEVQPVQVPPRRSGWEPSQPPQVR